MKDGGPAFPTREATLTIDARTGPEVVTFLGMSLRDYFAAAALNGYLSEPGHTGEDARILPDRAAAWAYENADAMLKARER